MNEQTLYKTALAKWGEDSQIKMLFEEMAELQKALCSLAVSNAPKRLSMSKRRLRTLKIMLGQMRVIFGDAGPDLIKAKKLKARGDACRRASGERRSRDEVFSSDNKA